VEETVVRVLAGTSKGVFAIEAGAARCVLESRGVRDLVQVGGRLFAGTGGGVYGSDDDGATWSDALLADREVWQIRAARDGVLYAGTQPAGLFASDDGGDTWSEVESFASAPEARDWGSPVEPKLPGRARALVIDRDDPARMWVGVEVGGIMSTVDRGRSWTHCLPGGNPDLHMLYAHPERPEVLFASTGYGRADGVADMVEGNAGVFRSADAGATWEYAWWGITPRYSRPMCIDARPPYGLTIASAPTAFSSFRDEGGAGAMLFRSDDHGDSWRSLCDASHSPSRANFHGLTPDPESTGGVLVGTDTGEVWRVGDDAHWQLLASGMPAVLAMAANG
jgi:photosystem II stability/assembly factor-like uncharacterized protein